MIRLAFVSCPPIPTCPPNFLFHHCVHLIDIYHGAKKTKIVITLPLFLHFIESQA